MHAKNIGLVFDSLLYHFGLRVHVRPYCRGRRPVLQPGTIRQLSDEGLQLQMVYQTGTKSNHIDCL